MRQSCTAAWRRPIRRFATPARTDRDTNEREPGRHAAAGAETASGDRARVGRGAGAECQDCRSPCGQQLGVADHPVAIDVLTEESLPRLIAAIRAAPSRSVILYVRYSQQAPDVPDSVRCRADGGRSLAGACLRRVGPLYRFRCDRWRGVPNPSGSALAWDRWRARFWMAPGLRTSRSKKKRSKRSSTGVSCSAGASARASCRPAATILFRQPGVWELYRVVHSRWRPVRDRAERADCRIDRAACQASPYGGRAAAVVRAESGSRRPLDPCAGRGAHAHRARSARRPESAARRPGHHVERSQAQDRQARVRSRISTGRSPTLQDRTSSLAQSLRNLSHELHPSVLQHAGLVATLRSHCADVEEHHRVTVKFSADDHLDSLSPEVSLCLFRVAQEALTNAVRHARARTIRVQLMANDEDVELSVVDDGIGFDASERSGSGLGLRSIDERVRLARGTVTVESRPGQGTTLRSYASRLPRHRPSSRSVRRQADRLRIPSGPHQSARKASTGFRDAARLAGR